ncbi:DUF6042 family protein [Streptomyces hirsutus]|uniref:DUF6042 family protein n=1 Tax=Streptomyces hirsutus TaxID=35620 RepID=UPI0033AE35DB
MARREETPDGTRWSMPAVLPLPGDLLPLDAELTKRFDWIRWTMRTGPLVNALIKYLIEAGLAPTLSLFLLVIDEEPHRARGPPGRVRVAQSVVVLHRLPPEPLGPVRTPRRLASGVGHCPYPLRVQTAYLGDDLGAFPVGLAAQPFVRRGRDGLLPPSADVGLGPDGLRRSRRAHHAGAVEVGWAESASRNRPELTLSSSKSESLRRSCFTPLTQRGLDHLVRPRQPRFVARGEGLAWLLMVVLPWSTGTRERARA